MKSITISLQPPPVIERPLALFVPFKPECPDSLFSLERKNGIYLFIEEKWSTKDLSTIVTRLKDFNESLFSKSEIITFIIYSFETFNGEYLLTYDFDTFLDGINLHNKYPLSFYVILSKVNLNNNSSWFVMYFERSLDTIKRYLCGFLLSEIPLLRINKLITHLTEPVLRAKKLSCNTLSIEPSVTLNVLKKGEAFDYKIIIANNIFKDINSFKNKEDIEVFREIRQLKTLPYFLEFHDESGDKLYVPKKRAHLSYSLLDTDPRLLFLTPSIEDFVVVT